MQQSLLSTGVVVLLYATITTSWNFVGGLTGYMSIGHAAWFGLGAYGTGLLIVRLDMPSVLALAIAAVIVAVISVPIGYIALKARGISFVIVTVALLLVLQLVFQGWAPLTGGSRGLAVPRPFPDMLRPEHHAVFFTLFALLRTRLRATAARLEGCGLPLLDGAGSDRVERLP